MPPAKYNPSHGERGEGAQRHGSQEVGTETQKADRKVKKKARYMQCCLPLRSPENIRRDKRAGI